MSDAAPETVGREAPPADEPWTVLRMLRWSAGYLEGKGVGSDARLDAEHLLAHTLGTTRLQLYLQFDRPLTPEELACSSGGPGGSRSSTSSAAAPSGSSTSGSIPGC